MMPFPSSPTLGQIYTEGSKVYEWTGVFWRALPAPQAAVSTAFLADDAVTAAKLADGSVTSSKLAAGAVAAGAVTGLGTAAVLDVPAAGDATAGQVVKGSDSRLTDQRTPTAHTHPTSDLTGTISTAQIADSAVTAAKTSITGTPTGSKFLSDGWSWSALPTASDTAAGTIEHATQSEVDAGTDSVRAVVPSTLAAWSKRTRSLSTVTSTTTVANSATETLLWSPSFTSTTFQAGDVILLDAWGDYINSSGVNRTATVRFRIGAGIAGTELARNVTGNLANNAARRSWRYRLTMNVISTSSQSFSSEWSMTVAVTSPVAQTAGDGPRWIANTSSFNMAAGSFNLTLSVQHSLAAATIDMRILGGAVQLVRP